MHRSHCVYLRELVHDVDNRKPQPHQEPFVLVGTIAVWGDGCIACNGATVRHSGLAAEPHWLKGRGSDRPGGAAGGARRALYLKKGGRQASPKIPAIFAMDATRPQRWADWGSDFYAICEADRFVSCGSPRVMGSGSQRQGCRELRRTEKSVRRISAMRWIRI